MEGDHLRQKIIDEATTLFVSQGFRGISMREIAQSAGLSKAGLYYHFRDKEDLFLTILAQSLDRTSVIAERSAATEGSTRTRITRFVQELLGVSERERAVVRLAHQEMIHVSLEARAKFAITYRTRFLAHLETIFEEGQQRSEIKKLTPHLAATLLLGMCFPFLCREPEMEMSRQTPLPPNQDLVPIIVGTFFDGLTSPERDTPSARG